MNQYNYFFRELYEEAIYYALKTHPMTTLGDFLLHVIYNPDKYDMSIFYFADFHSRLDTDFNVLILKRGGSPPLAPQVCNGVRGVKGG